METSRRDAAPINSQFKVILLKELFFIRVCEQVPLVFKVFLFFFFFSFLLCCIRGLNAAT